MSRILESNGQTIDVEFLKNKYGVKSLHVIEFNPTVIHKGGRPQDETLEVLSILHNPDYDPDYPSLTYVFKKVGFDVLAASSAIAQSNPAGAIKMQMDACLLEGDRDQLFNPQDSTVFASVMNDFVKITQARSTFLKKI
jgi:hypothetical protein